MTTIHRWNEHQMLVPSVYGSHMCPQGAKLPTVVKDHHKRDGPSPPSGACPFHGACGTLGGIAQESNSSAIPPKVIGIIEGGEEVRGGPPHGLRS